MELKRQKIFSTIPRLIIKLLVLLLVSSKSFSQENKISFVKYNLLVENGFGINFSKIYYNQNLSKEIQPGVKQQKGYYYSFGIEKIVNNNAFSFKIKRVYMGNTFTFSLVDSLNQTWPLFVGIARPTFILNTCYGKQFTLKKLRIGFNIGIDYFLFYKVNSFSAYTYDLGTAFISGRFHNRSIAGTFINPCAEFNLTLPVTIKKADRFSIGYSLMFSLGLRQIHETNYEVVHRGNNYSVKNKNNGTYLINALVIKVPLRRKG